MKYPSVLQLRFEYEKKPQPRQVSFFERLVRKAKSVTITSGEHCRWGAGVEYTARKVESWGNQITLTVGRVDEE